LFRRKLTRDIKRVPTTPGLYGEGLFTSAAVSFDTDAAVGDPDPRLKLRNHPDNPFPAHRMGERQHFPTLFGTRTYTYDPTWSATITDPASTDFVWLPTYYTPTGLQWTDMAFWPAWINNHDDRNFGFIDGHTWDRVIQDGGSAPAEPEGLPSLHAYVEPPAAPFTHYFTGESGFDFYGDPFDDTSARAGTQALVTWTGVGPTHELVWTANGVTIEQVTECWSKDYTVIFDHSYLNGGDGTNRYSVGQPLIWGRNASAVSLSRTLFEAGATLRFHVAVIDTHPEQGIWVFDPVLGAWDFFDHIGSPNPNTGHMVLATTTVAGSVSFTDGTGIETQAAPSISPGTLVVPIIEIHDLDGYNIETGAPGYFACEMHVGFDAPFPPYVIPCSTSGCLTPGP
jgi:hypothetical protein